MYKCFTCFPGQHTADPTDVSQLSKGSSAGGRDMNFHVQGTIKDYAKIPGHVCDLNGPVTNYDVSPVGLHGVTLGEGSTWEMTVSSAFVSFIFSL